MMKNKRGFTFVEMLMSTVMTATLAITLYAMLANGLKVWQTVTQDQNTIDVNLFFENINYELQNSFDFSKIAFSGDSKSLEFTTILNRFGLEGEVGSQVGWVKYDYDSNSKSVDKANFTYRQMESFSPDAVRSVVSNAEKLNFQYFFYDQKKDSFFWVQKWPIEEFEDVSIGVPQAVRVELIVSDGAKGKKRVKIVQIPAGGVSNQAREIQ